MPIVVNINTSATSASFNLSRGNEALRKSLGRLSSDNRTNSFPVDVGGLSVAPKFGLKTNRTGAVRHSIRNSLSYLQVEDSSLQTMGKIPDRMAELRTMAQDVTKDNVLAQVGSVMAGPSQPTNQRRLGPARLRHGPRNMKQ